MRRYFIIVAFLFKLVKGVDHKRMRRNILQVLKDVEDNPIEIVIQTKVLENIKNKTLHYYDIPINLKERLNREQTQLIQFSSITGFSFFYIYLN